MSEAELLRQILLKYSRGDTRLFRNSVGNFWQGKVLAQSPNLVTLGNPRRVFCGLTDGASDLIGWHSVVVTPEMVGERVAVFVGTEGKGPKGRLRPKQQTFISALAAAGGCAGVAKSVDDVALLLTVHKIYPV